MEYCSVFPSARFLGMPMYMYICIIYNDMWNTCKFKWAWVICQTLRISWPHTNCYLEIKVTLKFHPLHHSTSTKIWWYWSSETMKPSLPHGIFSSQKSVLTPKNCGSVKKMGQFSNKCFLFKHPGHFTTYFPEKNHECWRKRYAFSIYPPLWNLIWRHPN